MLNILHVTSMYPTPARPSRGSFVKSQIDSLKSLANVEVFVIDGGNGALPYLRQLNSLRKRLRQDYDLVHVHYGHLATMVKILGTDGTPIASSYCGTDLLADQESSRAASRPKDRFWAKLNRSFASRDALSIVKSHQLGDQINEFVNHYEVLPNGVDFDTFKPMDRDTCRAELGISSDKPVILFGASKTNTNKNFQLLERATALHPGKFEVITFTGADISHKDVPIYMNAADLVVLTSKHEGSPNVVKEASACNRPVFATDCGDVRYMLGGIQGSRVLGYDTLGWAEALADLLGGKLPKSNNGRLVLKQKGVDRVSTAERLHDIYLEICGVPETKLKPQADPKPSNTRAKSAAA